MFDCFKIPLFCFGRCENSNIPIVYFTFYSTLRFGGTRCGHCIAWPRLERQLSRQVSPLVFVFVFASLFVFLIFFENQSFKQAPCYLLAFSAYLHKCGDFKWVFRERPSSLKIWWFPGMAVCGAELKFVVVQTVQIHPTVQCNGNDQTLIVPIPGLLWK